MRKGFISSIKIELVYSVVLMVGIYFGAYWLVYPFVGDEGVNVIKSGVLYLQTMAFFYFLPGLTNALQGFFRGIGKLKVTLNSTFFQIFARAIAAYIFAPHWGMSGIAYACLIGWIVMLAYEVPTFLKVWRN